MTTEETAAANTGLALVAIQRSTGTLAANQILVLRINPESSRDGENRHLRQTETR